jgi:transitional endoplasmic reticulum ATPase
MKVEIETCLQSATYAYRSGLEALASGRQGQARADFALAANFLMDAADLSSPALAQSRRQAAQRLMDYVDGLGSVDARPVAVKSPEPRKSQSDENEEAWLVSEKPETRFEDVAGLEDVKGQIRLKLIYPYRFPEKAARYGIQAGGGILLYGPPGTGKTMIARAVAGEIDAAFYAIKPSAIMSEWVGVAERNIARLFAEAGSHALSIVFIDELESLTPRRRSSGSSVMVRVVPQILAELDGFRKRANPMLFIGATNEPWAIDSAILRPGRLDRLIYVPPPDQPARRQIFSLNLKNVPLAPDVDLDGLASATGRFSGADMTGLCKRVCEKVFIEAIQQGVQREIGQADFESVLTEMRPSISEDDLRIYSKFALTGSK